MPELPEVHTTVEGLKKTIVGLEISDVWTNYQSDYKHYADQIKNPAFFAHFKRAIVGATVTSVERRHKNILIHLSNDVTVLIHMKMTGHLLFGTYVQRAEKTDIPKEVAVDKWQSETWIPKEKSSSPLWDPFNRHIRLVFSFSNGKHLALSDVRKFAKVTYCPTKDLPESDDLKHIGPEPLDDVFTFEVCKARIVQKKTTPIKAVLMDQTVIAGIGNIYSDEILFAAGVHPESVPQAIPENVLRDIYKHIRPILTKGIQFGGDSTSDYRDVQGTRGAFQGRHNAYRKTDEPCSKKDGGIIQRKVVRGRSAHFCSVHQHLYR